MELEFLIYMRLQAEGKVARMKEEIAPAEGDAPALTLAKVRMMMKKLEKVYEEFQDLHQQIMAKTAVADRKQHNEFNMQFDALHDETATALETWLEMLSVPEQPAGAVNRQPLVVQQSLPRAIPKFDGSYAQWEKFKVMFRDVVDKTNEPDRIKLYHLENALIGNAAGKIDAKTISDGNYGRAWEILTEQYENKRRRVYLHIGGLLDIKKLPKESYVGLQGLVESVDSNVENLKFLGQKIDGLSEQIAVYLIAQALDDTTKKLWESTVKKGELPTYEATINFLKERVSVLERCESSAQEESAKIQFKQAPPKAYKQGHPKANAATTTTQPDIRCDFCQRSHPSFKCPEYTALSVSQRFNLVKERNVCFNCLRSGHPVKRCPSTKLCAKCQRKHHTSLHSGEGAQGTKSSTVAEPAKKPESPSVPAHLRQRSALEESKQPPPVTSAHSSASHRPSTQVLLLTALVDVLGSDQRPQACRALLDCGSQVSFISSSLATALDLPIEEVSVPISGIGSVRSTVKQRGSVNVRSRCSDFSFTVNCLISPKITSHIPSASFDISSWDLPPGILLADPCFNKPDKIDMLIGMDWFYDLMKPAFMKLSDEGPSLQDSKLGWLVGGKVQTSPLHAGFALQALNAVSEPFDQILQKFWEVESVSPEFCPTSEDEKCESQFLATHYRNDDGRYVVQLPLRDEVSKLVSSRSLALRRFFMLESKLSRYPDLKSQYDQFMDEYESLGHCREVKESDDPPDLVKWYLPHHAVLRPSNTTTKCRVVFDASAKVSGSSLNDVMMVGPTVQRDLLSIILSFRKHQYVLSADIAKMYRQILVDPRHTPLQRIFWRKSPSAQLRVLELSTVTYGTAAAPFLATRALLQLARDEKDRFPLAAKVIEKNVYVDDALFGSNSLDEAFEMQFQLIQLLKSAGMELHKWSSNEELLMVTIPLDKRDSLVSLGDCGINEVIKTLGLMWDPLTDEFVFVSQLPLDCDNPTKRKVLSAIARVYDPIGFIAPVILIGKLLMQALWKSKLKWDEKLDEYLTLRWKSFLSSLPILHQIRIPRQMMLTNAVGLELHGFADASKVAYGANVYIRSLFADGSAQMRLVTSKSKVAPIKEESIPRLEGLAALLLARLMRKVLDAIGDHHFSSIVCWSDSQVVLAWLKKPLDRLQMWVRNRIAEILSCNFVWQYIPSSLNPADIVSRGQSAEELVRNPVWWNGSAPFRTVIYSVEVPPELPDSEIPELKPEVVVSTVMVYEEFPLLTKFESFRKTQRVVGYVLRFISNCRKPNEGRVRTRYLTIRELRVALLKIVEAIQAHEFSREIESIQSDEPNHRLNSLKPFLDGDLLRVGGRIRHSKLPYGTKHQLILPNKNPVVRSLIEAVHRENLHVGPSAVITILRQQFWLLNAKSTVRNVLRSCVQCFKTNPSTIGQQMGDLPSYRVDTAPAFQKVGVDFAGPIMIKQSARRAVPVKGYICVFVCMVTKAIHLEAVEDLSTEAFLGAFQRFVSRRGIPEHVFSDNGTNFVGAKSELHELYLLFQARFAQDKIFDYCHTKEITWTTIPPHAPHFGGLWEAGVKSVKSVLKKVYQSASMTIAEFSTLLCQIEALLNSRPLFAHSSDPQDFEVLTPGHFLINRPLIAVPEPTYEDIPSNRLSRWQRIQQLREHFWKRWSQEYVTELQVRGKWLKKSPNVRPDTIVLIKDDNLPPQCWKMGRIVKLYPGADGLVRVVDVKTQSGIFKRPIHKLAPLPILDNRTSETAESTSSRGEHVQSASRTEVQNSVCAVCAEQSSHN